MIDAGPIPANSFIIGPAVINTHLLQSCSRGEDEPRPVWMSLLINHALVNAGGLEIV